VTVPSKQPNVRDHIRVNMHRGKIVDAVIKAILDLHVFGELDILRIQ
jgi:hypothetical protein